MLPSRAKFDHDVDKEIFEKSLASSIQKAINSSEGAVKEKHARIVIIASHKEKSSITYWNVIRRLPVQDNPLVAWKFCHVTHKLLRDGHANVLPESQHSIKFMADLGKMWGHLKEGYGYLIASYIKLLNQKLIFHKKIPLIPGNLLLDDSRLDEICHNDINSYFELSVDMLDYLDSILQLQAFVFNSLDLSRSNSMTSSGQCKLAPLILCIQDSCQLYHFLVQILFKLHSSLPSETLAGHRERFYKAFNILKQFYINAKNLQYFKNLIQIPDLPTSPPNFLRASELNSHVKPMALVSQEELPNEPDTNDQSDEIAFLHSLLMERELNITELNKELARLKLEVDRLKQEHQVMIQSATNKIRELEIEYEAHKQLADSLSQENELLKTAMKETEKQLDSDKIANIEKLAKANEDKFLKMKEIYSKLREEHVNLLKTYSDSSRQVAAAKKEKEICKQELEKVQSELTFLKEEQTKVEEQLVRSSSTAEQLSEALSNNESLSLNNTVLKDKVEALEKSLKDLEKKIELEKQISLEKALELDKISKAKLYDENQLHLEMKEKSQLAEKIGEMISNKQISDNLIMKLTKDKEEFESKIKSTQKEKEDLDCHLKDLKSKYEILTESNRKLLENFNDIKSLSSEKNVQCEELCVSLEKLKAENASLSESLKTQKVHLTSLQESMNTFSIEKLKMEEDLNTQMNEIEKLKSEKALETKLKLDEEERNKKNIELLRKQIIEKIVRSNIAVIQDILSKVDDPNFLTIRSTAEYLLEKVTSTKESFKEFVKIKLSYYTKPSVFNEFVELFCNFIQLFNMVLNFGFATAHCSSLDAAEELKISCTRIGSEEMKLLQCLINGSIDEFSKTSAIIEKLLDEIIIQTTALLPIIDDVRAEKIDDLIEEEMQQTTKAIEQAASRLAEILSNSKSNQSGFQLEVNEKILDSCNNLMLKIRILIEKSKILQKEIVAQGKGTSSIKDFYKKHHRWTEGLISAAKAVGFGANILVDAADKVVNQKGKFEELVVCAQEIAASTAQLVAASKVKADIGSTNLIKMSEASKGVSEATGLVVVSAKSGAERMEEMEIFDFSKLTLHQAKRKEMDSQVKVLELESNLEKERRRLAELRKAHYQLDEDLE